MTLGEYVHAYRKAHGLTMQQFADRAFLSKGYVSLLEKGRDPRSGQPIQPSLTTYIHIARAMGMTRTELMKHIDIEEEAEVPDAPPQPPKQDAPPFDPVSALLDDYGVRTVARNRIGDATPQEVDTMREQLKGILKILYPEGPAHEGM